jgi:hypothetical protein
MEIAENFQRILDFQEMDRKAMAAELLQAARDLVDSGVFKEDPSWSYDERALYRVIPGLARRLDPEVELRASEIPQDSEKDDPITFVDPTDDEKLLRQVSSIIRNASFMRAQECERNSPARKAIDFLILHRSDCSAISVAMDTVCPGAFPKRATPDTRPPLEGFQLIAASENDYEGVLRYEEKQEDLDDWLRVAEMIAKNEEIDDADADMARRLRSYTSPENWMMLAIQNCATGEVYSKIDLKTEDPEMMPTL